MRGFMMLRNIAATPGLRAAAAATAGGAATYFGLYSRDDADTFLSKTKQATKNLLEEKFATLDNLRGHLHNLPKDVSFSRFKQMDEVLSKLDNMVGMEDIKDKILEIGLFALTGVSLRSDGSQDPAMMNVLITAPPGSGKSTLAQIIAEVYVTMGVVPQNKITELRRQDLIKGHVGGSTDSTGALLEAAKGGVVIIDEAHSLADQGGMGGYGQEVINLIVAFITANKDTKFIFCGYPDEIANLLQQDKGFKRRIGWHLQIPEAKADDLALIFKRMCEQKEFSLKTLEFQCLQKIIASNRPCFPENGGNIETFFTKCMVKNAAHSTHYRGVSKLREFSEADLKEGFQDYMQSQVQVKDKKSWWPK
jgi:adenylate kinase family enzyme